MDTTSSLHSELVLIINKFAPTVQVSKKSLRPTTFILHTVKMNPEEVFKVYYEQSSLSSHLNAMIASLKDLQIRLNNLKLKHSYTFNIDSINHVLNGSGGLNYYLLEGEYELRQTTAYLAYLRAILNYAGVISS
uniref:Transcriptional regulator n=1 Tax=Panagrellus redivivus TaxID=6233 RepID=A0A7E4V3X4_PANRE